jgi:hypothetical protein
MALPEKIGWWDRLFNRYRKEIVNEGSEPWIHYPFGTNVDTLKISYTRYFIKYKVIDRVTGSETIEKEYFN